VATEPYGFLQHTVPLDVLGGDEHLLQPFKRVQTQQFQRCFLRRGTTGSMLWLLGIIALPSHVQRT
jgi:hypothetical protein